MNTQLFYNERIDIMTEVITYYAFDGKKFEHRGACLKYEYELKKKIAQRRDAAEKKFITKYLKKYIPGDTSAHYIILDNENNKIIGCEEVAVQGKFKSIIDLCLYLEQNNLYALKLRNFTMHDEAWYSLNLEDKLKQLNWKPSKTRIF